MFNTRTYVRAILLVIVWFIGFPYAQGYKRVLELDDPLDKNTTVGTQNGGVFTAEGWETTNSFDHIQYNIETCPAGEVEFEVQGIYGSKKVFPNLSFDKSGNLLPDAVNVHYTLFSMYDRDPNNAWYGTKQWHNPYKCIVHLYGYMPSDRYKWRRMKLRLNVSAFNGGYDDDPHAFEDPAVGPFDWQKTQVYHHRLVWGNGHMLWYLNGELIKDWDYSSFGVEYAPPYHSLRIGSALNTRIGGFQAPIDISYRNFKFYRHVDQTAPQVVGVEPSVQNGGIPVDADIFIHFSEPMDKNSAENAVSIQPSVPGRFKWIGNALLWEKDSFLQPNTTYTIRIKSDAKDLSGISLTGDFLHTFTTRGMISERIGKYQQFEVPLIASGLGNNNRYKNVDVKGVFRGPTETIEIEGFWDGGDIWKVRMAPSEVGKWTYEITSSVPGLRSSGSFECTDNSERGFIRVNPLRPYSFMYDDGTPWLWKGDTAWRGYTALITYEGRWKDYIDLRASQGYTAMQSIVVSYINGLNFWKNEGGTCFVEGSERKDYDRLNPGYFRWIDKRLDYAIEKGIIPVILFTWAQEYVNFTEAQFARFVRYLVARYAAKNVIWCLCGEYNEIPGDFGGSTSEFNQWGRLVKQYDPYDHLITLHPTGRSSSAEFAGKDWYDFIMQQTPYYVRDIRRDRGHGIPVVNGEPRYMYPGEDNTESRMGLWEIVTNGGYYTAGFYTTYAPDKGGWDMDALPEEQRWVSYLNFIMSRLPIAEMEPHQEWITPGNLLAKPGSEYLAYYRNGGEVNIDLTKVNGSLPFEWYNPRTATTEATGVISGGGIQTFTPPFSGDWALHIGKGVKHDSIPPNTPLALISPAQTMNSVTLSWQPPAPAPDGETASMYVVFREGISIATVKQTGFTDTGLEEAAAYLYEVYAIDAQGNKSPSAASITVSTGSDNQAPQALEMKIISQKEIHVFFDEKIEKSSAENTTNYKIVPSVQIVSARLQPDQKTVNVKTDDHQPGQNYTLEITNISDLARNPNTMSTNKQFEYQFELTLQINNINPGSYKLAEPRAGDSYYVDRDFRLVKIPEICQNTQWIMTENDDKMRIDTHWLSFDTNMPATVFVAFDKSTPLPAWLQTWHSTGYEIDTTDDSPLLIYRMDFPPGSIVLGANEGKESSSMYAVMVKKADTTVTDTLPPAVPRGFKFGLP